MQVKRVLLVRHGETDYNVTGRWQGQLDTALNAHGHSQANLVGETLQNEGIGVIYTSDLTRALDTAKGIGRFYPQVPMIQDARLREIHLGIFQGLTRQQISDTYPLEYNYWQQDDHYTVPKGESRIAMRDRMYTFWQDMLAKESHEVVAVVSHGGSLRWLLTRIFSPEVMLGRHLDNTSVTVLDWQENEWQLTRIGDTTHLQVF